MHIPEVDRWISAEFSRLAEIVQDYDPNLELRWIPPEARTDPEDRANPYCIWDKRTNTPVMFASEQNSPVEILQALFMADNQRVNVLDSMISHNAAMEAFRMKEELEKAEEMREFSAFVLKNEKSVWRHNGRKFDAEFRELDPGKTVI